MIHERIPSESGHRTTSLLLCPDCYSWNQPIDGRCPECHQVVDSGIPDPSMDVLATAIGELSGRLGTICVRRKMLPDRGTLYATTNGLYFLPHCLEQRREESAEEVLPASLFWSLAAVVWSPLTLLLPLMRARQVMTCTVPVLRPHILGRRDSRLLPDLLMQNPGVFFVAKRSIRNIGRWGNRWKITRTHATPVRLKPENDRPRFHARMTRLITSQTWQEALPG